MREMLVWQAGNELAAIESIDRLKLLACVKQLRNLVSRVFNLTKYVSAGFLRVQYDHNQDIVSGPHSIMGVHKVTDELAGVKTARRARTRIGAKKQRHVETRLVGAINNRRSLSKPVEKVPAVSALGDISLQRSTPSRAPVSAERVTEGTVNSEEGTDNLSVRTDGIVQKSPFPPGPQALETTSAPRAVFGVRKRDETVEKTDEELKNNFTAGIIRSVFDAS